MNAQKAISNGLNVISIYNNDVKEYFLRENGRRIFNDDSLVEDAKREAQEFYMRAGIIKTDGKTVVYYAPKNNQFSDELAAKLKEYMLSAAKDVLFGRSNSNTEQYMDGVRRFKYWLENYMKHICSKGHLKGLSHQARAWEAQKVIAETYDKAFKEVESETCIEYLNDNIDGEDNTLPTLENFLSSEQHIDSFSYSLSSKSEDECVDVEWSNNMVQKIFDVMDPEGKGYATHKMVFFDISMQFCNNNHKKAYRFCPSHKNIIQSLMWLSGSKKKNLKGFVADRRFTYTDRQAIFTFIRASWDQIKHEKEMNSSRNKIGKMLKQWNAQLKKERANNSK